MGLFHGEQYSKIKYIQIESHNFEEIRSLYWRNSNYRKSLARLKKVIFDTAKINSSMQLLCNNNFFSKAI